MSVRLRLGGEEYVMQRNLLRLLLLLLVVVVLVSCQGAACKGASCSCHTLVHLAPVQLQLCCCPQQQGLLS